jgi:hypothetical protein
MSTPAIDTGARREVSRVPLIPIKEELVIARQDGP